jgi:hypothetical protein
MISHFSLRRNVKVTCFQRDLLATAKVFGRTSTMTSNKMTRDFSVGKMIISPSVPLPSFALSDSKDMHSQLQTRDKSARLEKKQETSLDTYIYNADDMQDAPKLTCVS